MYYELREENFKAIATLNIKQKKKCESICGKKTTLSFFQKPKSQQNKRMYTKYADIKLKQLQHFN